jgi:hypothetical protein
LTDNAISKNGKSMKSNGNEDPSSLEIETLTTLSGDNEPVATDEELEPDNAFKICYGNDLKSAMEMIITLRKRSRHSGQASLHLLRVPKTLNSFGTIISTTAFVTAHQQWTISKTG